MRLILFILFFVLLGLLWKVTPLSEYATPDYIAPKLEAVRDTDWAVPAALGIYIACTMLFFPHVVMTMAVVLAFPPSQSVPVILIGSLVSAALGYAIGRRLGMGSLQFLTGKIAEKIFFYARHGGILGLTVLRMVPTGPYTAVNIVLGMSRAPFYTFLAATLLGLLPGTTIGALLGSSFVDGFESPSTKTMLYIAIAFTGWVAVLAGAYFFSRSWEKKHSTNLPA